MGSRTIVSRDWRAFIVVGGVLLAQARHASAAQFDIPGPPGSRWFGQHVAVLPNGNFVVTDPGYSTATSREIGAVHLFDPGGVLISTLTGGSPGDHVGNNPIVVLANSNFVVSTPDWNNGAVAGAGAATWIDGASGISGVVSAANSLVGTSAGDAVGGYNGVVALSNGNYVVRSSWSSPTAAHVGAVTWADGATGIVGAISTQNSLLGSEPYDFVGDEQSDYPGIIALPNGNYVVTSAYWHHASRLNFGAITLGDGRAGTVGSVGPDNSLVGTTICLTDVIGLTHQVQVLANGNVVVPSPCWSDESDVEVGAVTWVDGVRGVHGEVSVHNSFVGVAAYDRVGYSGITPLTNGNYVIRSFDWGGGRGAATWADGTRGRTGHATPANSLIGSVGGAEGDFVGAGVTPLANGNYVVHSPWWNGAVGAVTWGDGRKGSRGIVSASNSLTGAVPTDFVGFGSVAALPGGDYAVASPYWSSAVAAQVGAVTWLRGDRATAAVVGAGNSVIGAQANDRIGGSGVFAVGNGNYIVLSADWSNGAAARAGAVTWLQGGGPRIGVVSAANSLVGSTAGDALGYYGSVRLGNGNFVVASSGWHNATGEVAGAFTWIDGDQGRIGAVAPENSLVGTAEHSGSIVTALVDGNYTVSNRFSLFGEIESFGSITLAAGPFGLAGPIAPWNSVIAEVTGYQTWKAAYDPPRKRLIVGRPDVNVVTLFTPSETIFASGFEP